VFARIILAGHRLPMRDGTDHIERGKIGNQHMPAAVVIHRENPCDMPANPRRSAEKLPINEQGKAKYSRKQRR